MQLSTLKFITVLLLVTLISWKALAQEPAPNIIFFLADDMGWGDSQVYNPDSKIPMPNLDKLAEEGMRFTDAHTSAAVCAPTRYSALTGNYHWRGRFPYGRWKYRGGSQILSDQWTVADILKDKGYNTALFGKLHLGGDFYKKNSNEFATPEDPEDQIDFARGLQNGPLSYGFNYSYLLPRSIHHSPYAFFENDQLVGDSDDLFIWSSGTYGNSVILNDGIGMPYYDSSEVGPILAQKTIEFIDQHHQNNLAEGTNTPFFLYYAAQSAHTPYTPPDFFHGNPVKGVTGMTPHTDMIYEIDVALSRLMEACEERGLINNTLIIFTSDNGGIPDEIHFGHDAVGGLKGQKPDIWEGGHRVPFVAKWGDGTLEGSVIPPGTTSNQLIGVHDLAATLAELAGKSLLLDQARDSFNFLPVLLGQGTDAEPVRDHLLMEAGYPPSPNRSSIRVGQWKLILDEINNVLGLYNLADDLAETNNLMDDPSQAERIELMRNRFFELRWSDRTAPGPCDGKEFTIEGTEDHDVITGTDGPDVIDGLGGHDVIVGRGGDDVICGGDGNDSIYGGPGNDTLYGENGNDSIYGGSGDDKLSGGSGPNNWPPTGVNNDTCLDEWNTYIEGCEWAHLTGTDPTPIDLVGKGD